MLQLSNILQKRVFSMKNSMKWFAIIAIVVIIGFTTASCGGSGGGFPNVKWEYMVFSHETGTSGTYVNETMTTYNEALNKKLNELGSQGWELVSSSLRNGQYTDEHVLILKRKL